MINANKPDRWNDDTRQSVMQYNEWFMDFAPQTYQSALGACLESVENILKQSSNLRELTPELLVNNPSALMTLRMFCAPPIARDRLAGLADVPRTQVKTMEEGRIPGRGRQQERFIQTQIPSLLEVIDRLLDRQLINWLGYEQDPFSMDLFVAKHVVADRLCGATSDPVIRNAQEARQLDAIAGYLNPKGYRLIDDASIGAFDMPHGTYAYHKNVRMYRNAFDESDGYVNTPVDVVIMPMDPSIDTPMLIECKSAGDFANTNKRRKEEDTKVTQLRATYGDVILYLFLCGYFDSTYLGYEAANHMDWIWEHRIEDFQEVGI